MKYRNQAASERDLHHVDPIAKASLRSPPVHLHDCQAGIQITLSAVNFMIFVCRATIDGHDRAKALALVALKEHKRSPRLRTTYLIIHRNFTSSFPRVTITVELVRAHRTSSSNVPRYLSYLTHPDRQVVLDPTNHNQTQS
jgi:hypothetical protein